MNIRKQIIEELCPLKQILTQEQYRKLTDALYNMPEYEFNQIIAEALYRNKQEGQMTNKDYVRMLIKAQEQNGITASNSALNDSPVCFLSDEENRALWEDICQTSPSDHICLKGKDDDAICGLWQSGSQINGIPSDLFFARTIPLMDCSITVDERDKDRERGRVVDYRVVIFPDYEERIEKDDIAVVGAALMEGAGKVVIPIQVGKGIDRIMTGRIGWRDIDKAQREHLARHISEQDIVSGIYAMLATWYGIQIALLHPTVKDVFRHPLKERVNGGREKGKKRHKRIVRYVKRHEIHADDIEAAYSGKEYTRHTLVWYVIGHWRHYANGKKVFIKPYWKGALRDLKRNLDEREREIEIGGENT